MRFFNLSLQWRLVLASFSGLLTYPANLLDSALGPDWYPPILSWWLILHGLLFGSLVLAPYVLRKDHRVLRVAALMLGSVMIYYTAIEVPGLVKIAFLGDTGPYYDRRRHRCLACGGGDARYRAAIGDTRVLGHEPARRHAWRLPLQPDVRDLSLGRVLTPVENLAVYIWLDRLAGTHLRSHVPGTAS